MSTNRHQIERLASLSRHPDFAALREHWHDTLQVYQLRIETAITIEEIKLAQGRINAIRALLNLFDVEIPAVLSVSTAPETEFTSVG